MIPTPLSRRLTIFENACSASIEAIEAESAPRKALLSEYGWLFLINDSNRFMQVLFGSEKWSRAEAEVAAGVIESRTQQIRHLGAVYRKFIIPEKSVIYRQFLPNLMSDLTPSNTRPALTLHEKRPREVYYLHEYLEDARSYGLLYFRGDTHPNWLGGWFIYKFIVEQLTDLRLVNASEIIPIAQLTPTVAAYDGDLWSQLDPIQKAKYLDHLGDTTARFGFELAISLAIPEDKRRAKRIPPPECYLDWFVGRETVAYERPDGTGPRAVIFRDSTLDLSHDLIAQHFSRSVFIWHQGEVFREVIEVERPDVVIHAMAERFVTRYPTSTPFGNIRADAVEV